MKRYRVRIDHPDGERGAVTVWTSDPETAYREAVEWIDRSQRRRIGDLPHEVEELGDEPTPHDLGTAPSDSSVDHRTYAFNGSPGSTPFRVGREQIIRATEELRTAEGPGWDDLRSSLQRMGYDPKRCAHVSPADDGEGPPFAGFVVRADGDLLGYRRFGLDEAEPGAADGTIMNLWVHPGRVAEEIAAARAILDADPRVQAPPTLAYTVQFWPITRSPCAYRVTQGPVELAIALASRKHVEEVPGAGLLDVQVVAIDEVDEGEEGIVLETRTRPDVSAAPGHTWPTLRWTVAFRGQEGEPIAIRAVTPTMPRAIAFATAGLVANHKDMTISEVTIPQIEYHFTIANDDIVDYWEIA